MVMLTLMLIPFVRRHRKLRLASQCGDWENIQACIPKRIMLQLNLVETAVYSTITAEDEVAVSGDCSPGPFGVNHT